MGAVSASRATKCRREGRQVMFPRRNFYSWSGGELRFTIRALRGFRDLRTTAGAGPSRLNHRLGVSLARPCSLAMSSGDGFPVQTIKPPTLVWESRRAMSASSPPRAAPSR